MKKVRIKFPKIELRFDLMQKVKNRVTTKKGKICLRMGKKKMKFSHRIRKAKERGKSKNYVTGVEISSVTEIIREKIFR